MPLSAATLTAVSGHFGSDFSSLPSASFLAGLGLSGTEQAHKLFIRLCQFLILEAENQDYTAVDARNPRSVALDNDGLMGEISIRLYVQDVNLNQVVTGVDLSNANGLFGLASYDLTGNTNPLIAGTPLATNYTVPLGQVLLDWARVLNSYDSDPAVDSYSQKVRISTSEGSDGPRTSIRIEFPVTGQLVFQAEELVDF